MPKKRTTTRIQPKANKTKTKTIGHVVHHQPDPPAAAKRGRFFSASRLNAQTGQVYIYDTIGGGFFGGFSSKSMIDALEDLGPVEDLQVFINSPGGDVFEGVTIYNILKRQSARVAIEIDGLAGSIASIIAMAGDTITMAENGMMMIHDPWAFAMGNADELRTLAETLDKTATTMLETYVARSGADTDVIEEMMAEETWLNAAEALELGLIGDISTNKELEASFDLERFGFKNVPREAVDRFVTPPPPAEPLSRHDAIAAMTIDPAA